MQSKTIVIFSNNCHISDVPEEITYDADMLQKLRAAHAEFRKMREQFPQFYSARRYDGFGVSDELHAIFDKTGCDFLVYAEFDKSGIRVVGKNKHDDTQEVWADVLEGGDLEG